MAALAPVRAAGGVLAVGLLLPAGVPHGGAAELRAQVPHTHRPARLPLRGRTLLLLISCQRLDVSIGP